MKECLIILAKRPIPGRVKTRLARDVGIESAAELSECFLMDLIENVKNLSIPKIISCDPKSSIEYFRNYNIDQLFIQRGNSIGERMYNSFMDCFKAGFSRAILIGSDSPDIPKSFFGDALSSLSAYDMVIGPTQDAGYYLIGFRRDTLSKDIFSEINWSTSRVWQETRLKIENNGVNCFTLPEWYDIDNISGLHHFFSHNVQSLTHSKTIQYIINKEIIS